MRYIFRPSLSPEPLGKTRSEAGFPQAVTSDGGPEYGRSKGDDGPRPAAAILRTANFAFPRGAHPMSGAKSQYRCQQSTLNFIYSRCSLSIYCRCSALMLASLLNFFCKNNIESLTILFLQMTGRSLLRTSPTWNGWVPAPRGPCLSASTKGRRWP